MHRDRRPLRTPGALVLAMAALATTAGCGGSAGSAGGGAAAAPPGAPAASAPARPAASGGKIKVEDGAGQLVFELSPSAKGFDVQASGGRKLGAVKVEADRVKVSDERGTPAFKVKQKDDGFKLYREPASAGGADVELAAVRAAGGDFKIKDAAGAEIYQGRAKEGKTKVTGPGGRSWKVKAKEDGLEVEDAAGKRLLRLKGLRSVSAAAFCAAPEFSPLQKAAVAAYSARIGP